MTSANASAQEIADQFSLLDGVDASARTEATIRGGASFVNASGVMNVTLGGVNFQPDGSLSVADLLVDLGT